MPSYLQYFIIDIFPFTNRLFSTLSRYIFSWYLARLKHAICLATNIRANRITSKFIWICFILYPNENCHIGHTKCWISYIKILQFQSVVMKMIVCIEGKIIKLTNDTLFVCIWMCAAASAIKLVIRVWGKLTMSCLQVDTAGASQGSNLPPPNID